MPEPQFSLLKPYLIFVGSGSGGLLRYWLGGVVQNWWGPQFPIGTFVVNVTGGLVTIEEVSVLIYSPSGSVP